MRCSVRHSKSPNRGSGRDEVGSQLGIDRGGTRHVQDRPLFKERGEQVEESPLTLVEMLSRNHGATPWGSPPAVRLQYAAFCGRPLFGE